MCIKLNNVFNDIFGVRVILYLEDILFFINFKINIFNYYN